MRPTQSYMGSQLFKSVSISTGLPIDQLNFLIGQSLALLFALFYRKCLCNVSNSTRQITSLVAGAMLGYFCFGYQIYNLLVLTTLSYIAILTCNPKVVQRVVLLIALMYLSYLHMLRLFHDYGGYTIDITGPIMIAVQKVTNVAFSMHDGMAKSENDENLTAEQKKYAVRKRPSFLEYYSYLFQFQTLLCGPLVFYNDYVEFIEGKNFSKHLESRSKTTRPSPIIPTMKKYLISAIFAVMLLTVATHFPITHLKDENFLHETPFLSKIVYLLFATAVARFKYYHAWIIGEVICNMSGLGFNGFKTREDGTEEADWNLMSNIDIWGYENSLNLRMALEYWNKTTQVWLRRTAYERNRSYKLLLTYTLSALWHGFYPGYYVTFLGGAFFTLAARNVRRYIRPFFQTNKQLAFIYDVMTYITTRIIMAYLVFPFVLLEFKASFLVYSKLYFFGHIFGLIAIFIVPMLFKRARDNYPIRQNGLKIKEN